MKEWLHNMNQDKRLLFWVSSPFFTEPFDLIFVIGVLVIGLMLHISGNILFKGYAPDYLLFAHGPK